MKTFQTSFWWLVVFVLLMWLPMLQTIYPVFNGGELKGAYVIPQDTAFSFTNWFSGDFARQKENYIGATFGFKSDLVRLRNQLQYSLLGKTNGSTILGKSYYTFEECYVAAVSGSNFMGENRLNEKVKWTKELQDTLEAHGKTFFVVIAPGKGRFFQQYFLDEWLPAGEHTNYDYLIPAFDRAGVRVLNLHKWFMAMRDTSRYALYSRGGIHWSYYGETLAFDSILHYVEQQRNRPLPKMKRGDIRLQTTPRYRDNDAAEALNLIYYPTNDTLAYPTVAFEGDTANLKMMCVGDSYYWIMYGWAQRVFGLSSFWYYFDQLHTPGIPIRKTESISDPASIIADQDVVMLLYSEGSLHGYSFDIGRVLNPRFREKNYFTQLNQ